MTNAFEYGDALLADVNQRKESEDDETEPRSPLPLPSNQPYLNLATYVCLPSPVCLF